jgi:flagellar assembly protein FliH
MLSSDFAPLFEGEAPASEGFRPFDSGAMAAEPVAAEPAAVVDDGRAAAFEEGRAVGATEARAELAALGQGFVQGIEALAAFRQTLRERYETELLAVALGVARTVVQRELTERPELWLDMLRVAIRRAVDRERVVVRVPAVLAEFLGAHAAELRAALADVKEVEVVEDPGLPPGGCVLESRFGEVDLGVDTQLAETERALGRAAE